MLILLAPPANNERGPRYMEKALAAIHQTSGGRQPLTLIYGRVGEQIGLMVRCSQAQRELVLGPISANYPQCRLAAVEDEPPMEPVQSLACDVRLAPEMFPILRHAQFEDLLNQTFADPVSSLLRAIRPEEGLDGRVEITVYPASHARCHHALRSLQLLDREFFRHHHRLAAFFARHITRWRGWWIAWILGRIAARSAHPALSPLETSTSRLHEREHDLQADADKIGGHLFEASLRLIVRARPERRADARRRLQSMCGALGAFTRSRLATFQTSRPFDAARSRRRVPRFLLSHEELATLWHPPTTTAGVERLHTSDFTELEPPAAFRVDAEAATLGTVRFRDDRRPVGLSLEDRRRHLYVIGKTGMGKTTLLQNLLAADIAAGRGACLVDPHGDLAEAALARVPRSRTNDVIYLDAGATRQIVPFNPLACPQASRIDLVTSGVVSAFKKLHDSWGPRLEDTLRNAVYAVVEQGGTLVTLTRLLGEKAFRERFVANIRDEVVRAFWRHEFAQWSDAYRTEAVAAIQNKIRPFLTNTTMRAIVSRPGPSLDLREIMDAGQVLIVNLSKGRVGEDNATLLGALLVTSLQQAAMTRADQPEGERRDFFLYVDEFQNFTTGSFAAVLSEARKFRLSLIVAHQYLAQLPEPTADAVWGNVGSLVAFQVGSDDAQTLALQLSKFPGQVAVEHLTGLPKYTAYARLLVDGLPSSPFSIRTLPPEAVALDPERAEIIRRVVQRRFSAPAQDGLAA